MYEYLMRNHRAETGARKTNFQHKILVFACLMMCVDVDGWRETVIIRMVAYFYRFKFHFLFHICINYTIIIMFEMLTDSKLQLLLNGFHTRFNLLRIFASSATMCTYVECESFGRGDLLFCLFSMNCNWRRASP